MAKRTGLGKGLGAIFGEDVMESAPANQLREEQSEYKTGKEKTGKAASVEKEEAGKEITLKLTQIEPNTGQPRKDFNQEMIQELADSIRQYGVLQPLLVQKKGDHYEIIAGAVSYTHLDVYKRQVRDGMPEDFYSIDLMNAYEVLGNVIGEAVEEDLVNEIFSKFCTGK